jgi:hypothetical protein
MRLTLLSFLLPFLIFFMSGCFDGNSKSDASSSGDTSPNTLNAKVREQPAPWLEEAENGLIDADDMPLAMQSADPIEQRVLWFEGSRDDLVAGYENAEDFRNDIDKKLRDTLNGASVDTVYVDYLVDNTDSSWGELPDNMNKVTIAYSSFKSAKLKHVTSMQVMVSQLYNMLENKKFVHVEGFTTEMYAVLVKKNREDECSTDCIEVVQYRFDFDDGRILFVDDHLAEGTRKIQFIHIVEDYHYSINYIKNEL